PTILPGMHLAARKPVAADLRLGDDPAAAAVRRRTIVINDLSYAFRALRRSPLFAISAIVTLGVGIAVNTIVFTLLNSLALRRMPVRDAERVVRLYPVDAQGHRQNLFSYPDYRDYQSAAAAMFEDVAA